MSSNKPVITARERKSMFREAMERGYAVRINIDSGDMEITPPPPQNSGRADAFDLVDMRR